MSTTPDSPPHTPPPEAVGRWRSVPGWTRPAAGGIGPIPPPRPAEEKTTQRIGEAGHPGAGGGSKSFAQNATMLLIARLADMLMIAVLIAIMNRMLGAVAMGKYYTVLATIYMVVIIPEMGMDQAFVRLTSKNPALGNVYLGVALVVRNLLAVVALGVVFLWAGFAHWEHDVFIATMWGCVWLLFDLSLSTNYAVFLAFERTEYETLLTLLVSLLTVPLTILELQMGHGVVGVFRAIAIANIVTALVGWYITSSRFLKPVFRWEPVLWKEMLTLTFVLGFSRATRIIYGRIDTVLLNMLVPGSSATKYTAIAIYQTGYNLIRRVIPLQSIFARPLLPVAVRVSGNKERMQILHKRSFKLLLLIAVPGAAYIAGVAPIIVHILTGHRFAEFAPSVGVLAVLSLLVLTTFGSSSVRVVMVALEMQNFLLKHSTIMVVINLILDIIFIPLCVRMGWGPWWGPVFASIIAEAYLLTVIVTVVSRRVGCWPDLGDTLKILGSGAVMYGAMRFTAQWSDVAPWIIGPVVFFGLLLGTRTLRKQDITFLNEFNKEPVTPAQMEARKKARALRQAGQAIPRELLVEAGLAPAEGGTAP